MPKRFTVRQVKARSYTRQGWVFKEVKKFAVYDREWRKNMEAVNGPCCAVSRDQEDGFKYVETVYTKACAQHFADWLNVNRSGEYGHILHIPGRVFEEALKLM